MFSPNEILFRPYTHKWESPKDVACKLMNFRNHLLLVARVI